MGFVRVFVHKGVIMKMLMIGFAVFLMSGCASTETVKQSKG